MARREPLWSSTQTRVRLALAGVAGAVAVAGGVLVVSAVGGALGDRPATPPATEPTAPHFPDGASASAAAELLIGPYIVSTYGTVVSDVACSTPPTGAEGDQFICYGMKPDNLVIALRATIAADLAVNLEILVEQQPAPVVVPSSEPPLTTG